MLKSSEMKKIYAIKGIFESLAGNLSLAGKPSDEGDFLSFCSYLLECYTASKLTYQTDRWLGIAGLAMRLSQTVGVTCTADLWKENLVECLGWYIPRHLDVQPFSVIESTAPSWSGSTSVLQSRAPPQSVIMSLP